VLKIDVQIRLLFWCKEFSLTYPTLFYLRNLGISKIRVYILSSWLNFSPKFECTSVPINCCKYGATLPLFTVWWEWRAFCLGPSAVADLFVENAAGVMKHNMWSHLNLLNWHILTLWHGFFPLQIDGTLDHWPLPSGKLSYISQGISSTQRCGHSWFIFILYWCLYYNLTNESDSEKLWKYDSPSAFGEDAAKAIMALFLTGRC